LASLRIRLFLLVLLAVVPGLVLTVYSASQQRRQERLDVGANALRLARLASAAPERLINGTNQLRVALAHMPAVRARDPGTCGTHGLKDHLDTSPPPPACRATTQRHLLGGTASGSIGVRLLYAVRSAVVALDPLDWLFAQEHFLRGLAVKLGSSETERGTVGFDEHIKVQSMRESSRKGRLNFSQVRRSLEARLVEDGVFHLLGPRRAIIGKGCGQLGQGSSLGLCQPIGGYRVYYRRFFRELVPSLEFAKKLLTKRK